MNDFTRAELQELSGALCYCINQREPELNSLIPLLMKLEEVIHNYPKCDHRSGLWNYNEKGERVTYATDIYRCRHCDVLFKFLYEEGSCIGHEDLI